MSLVITLAIDSCSSIAVSQSLVSSHEDGWEFPFKFAAVKQLAEVTFVLAHPPLNIIGAFLLETWRERG
jgi:hypothetical protein